MAPSFRRIFPRPRLLIGVTLAVALTAGCGASSSANANADDESAAARTAAPSDPADARGTDAAIAPPVAGADDAAENPPSAGTAVATQDPPITRAQDTSEPSATPEPVARNSPPVTLTFDDDGTAHAPEFSGLIGWLNSEPLTIASLQAQNRVVLIEFWTYTCINCQRTLPYVRAWDEKYRDAGLTIVGVHTPEFDFEKKPENVAAAVRDDGLAYPIALDSDRATWRAWQNHAWPAQYLVDADGRVRYSHVGEGSYDQTEQAIRAALTEAGWDVSGIPLGGTVARHAEREGV